MNCATLMCISHRLLHTACLLTSSFILVQQLDAILPLLKQVYRLLVDLLRLQILLDLLRLLLPSILFLMLLGVEEPLLVLYEFVDATRRVVCVVPAVQVVQGLVLNHGHLVRPFPFI